MSDDEKRDVPIALQRFNDKIRPIESQEYGRCIHEMLLACRGTPLAHVLATIDLMATNPRMVGDPYVTPLLVSKTLLIWEKYRQPRTWHELENRKRNAVTGRR